MRTTLNLDDDVAAQLAELAEERHASLSSTASEVLRAGLRALRTGAAPARYEPPTFDTGRPLLDVTDVAEALEALDRE